MGNAGRGVDAAHGQRDEHDWRCCGGSEAYRQLRERRTRSMQGDGAADRGAGSELQAVGTL